MEAFSWAWNYGREVYSQLVPRAVAGAPARLRQPARPPRRRCSRQESSHWAAFLPAAAADLGPARTLPRPFAWHRPEARRGQSCPRRDCPVPGLTFSFAPSRAEPRAPRAQPAASPVLAAGLVRSPPAPQTAAAPGAIRAPSAPRPPAPSGARPAGPGLRPERRAGGGGGAAARRARLPKPGRGPAAAKRRAPSRAFSAPPALAAPSYAAARPPAEGAPGLLPWGIPAGPPGRSVRSSWARPCPSGPRSTQGRAPKREPGGRETRGTFPKKSYPLGSVLGRGSAAPPPPPES